MAETLGKFQSDLSQLPHGANVHGDVLDRYCNDRYELMLNSHPWQRLRVHTVIQTPAVFNTGTVSIAFGGTAGTMSGGTFLGAMDQRRIRINNRPEFYTYTFVDGANFTIDRPYEDPNGATAAPFKIWQAIYTLPSNVDFFESIEVPRLELDLDQVSQEELDQEDPGRFLGLIDGPYKWAPYDDSSAGFQQIELYPGPEIQEGLPARYREYIPRFQDTDSAKTFPLWVNTEVLFAGVEADLYLLMGNAAGYQAKEARFQKGLVDMKTQDNQRVVPMAMKMANRWTQHRRDRATGADALTWARYQLM